MPAPKTITIGDCVYTIDTFYKQGFAACAGGVSYHDNPYRLGSHRHSQWSYGHEFASEIPDITNLNQETYTA